MRIIDRTRRTLAALTLGLSLAACPGSVPDPRVDGGSTDGGRSDAGCADCCANGFCVHVLEPEETDLLQLSLAVREDGSAGVAYFHRVGADDYELRYREWKAGQASEPEVVATVQNVHGVSLAFTGSGQAAVSYLGGTDAEGSLEWLQSDAVVAFRNGDGTWTQRVAVTDGDQASAGNPVSDRGGVVGLHPALAFAGETAHLVYRDVHQGQFTDYASSDLEYASGNQSWSHAVVIPGGNEKLGWGGHSQLVIADGQPSVISDKLSRGPEGQGVDVVFSRRKPDGTWTQRKIIAEVADTQLGPSLAYHPDHGYAVAVHEATRDRLDFLSSTDGEVWTNPPIPVIQEGSSGWYPSVAIDPVSLAPSIAYYVCNRRLVGNQSDCSPDDDALRIAFRRPADWGDRLVDPEGGFAPKLAFLRDGRALVVYRHPFTGVLKLAVAQ